MPVPEALVSLYRLNVRPNSFTLSRGTQQVLSVDLSGRPLTWFREGTLYKRALDSHWLARRRTAEGRQRWCVPDSETPWLVQSWRDEVKRAQTELRSPLLERALLWTPEKLAAERERYALAYAPVSILPPDQYYAVVVQVTRGCSWNRCTFCTFYRDRPFSVQTPDAFAAHLHAVRDLLGEGVGLRQSVFIADGNALMLANGKLLPLLHAAREAFPERALYGFLDVFTGSRKTVQDWLELRQAGVQRVYLGLETGHDPLLAWLNKPGSAAQAIALCHDLKAAGLNIGPIFMTGLGGRKFADQHAQDTLKLLAGLPLGAGDLVYFSPLVPHGEYAEKARRDGIEPLSDAQVHEQERVFRAHLARVHPEVRAARYDIQEFIY